MKEISHKVFGKIKRTQNWWEREARVNFFKKDITIIIAVNGNENAEFEQIQIEAYNTFLKYLENLLLNAEISIYNYYQDVHTDYREKLEDSAEEFAPIISSKEEVGKLVQLTDIIFPWSFNTGVRQVGLLLNCTWEPEHGLAVKFENEKITDVGYQDIIL